MVVCDLPDVLRKRSIPQAVTWTSQVPNYIMAHKLGVQKVTRSGLNGVSQRDLLKDKFAFF